MILEFLATLGGKIAIIVVAAFLLNVGFNVWCKLDDMQLLKGVKDDLTGHTDRNPAYYTYRIVLTAAQVLTSSVLAYVTWGWNTHDWRTMLVWELGGNAGIVVAFLVFRFVVLERVLLRNLDNLEELVERNNYDILIAEGVALLGFSAVLIATLSGNAPGLAIGVTSSLVYIGLAMLIIWVGATIMVRRKTTLVENGPAISLSDAIKENNGNHLAAIKAAVVFAVLSAALYGALKGNFTTWTDSLVNSGITLPASLLIAWAMYTLLLKVIGKFENRLTLPWQYVTTAVTGLLLAAAAFGATGVISGTMASVL